MRKEFTILKRKKLPKDNVTRFGLPALNRQATVLAGIMMMWLAVLMAAAPGCSQSEPGGESAAHQTDQKAGVPPGDTLVTVGLQKIPLEVRAIGTVLAYQDVQISPEISGKVKKINCRIGDNVKQGDVLIEIDDEARQIDLNKKKALFAKAEAARQKAHKDSRKGGALFKDGVISDSESDDIDLDRKVADADLALARAEVKDARKKLRDTKISAPFDGKVALKEVEIGKLVTPGQSMLTLIDISKVKILVHISEMDIMNISEQSTVEAVMDSLPGKRFPASVESIGLKADDATRTFPVEVVVENEHGSLLPGMVARVVFRAKDPRLVIMIPRQAVRIEEGSAIAHVMHGGKKEPRKLSLGRDVGDQVIVEKGLQAGDTLIAGRAVRN